MTGAMSSSGAVRRFGLVLFVSAVSVTLIGERGLAQRSSDPARKVRQKTFEVVWKTVNDKYFDPQFGGVDWTAVRRTYEPELASVNDDDGLYDLLTRMLGELKISHLRILDLRALDRELARAEVTRGLTLRDLDGQVVVTRIVERSPAANAGLRAGFVLTVIDGTRVSNARDAESAIAFDTGMHRLTVLDEADATRDVSIGYALPTVERRLSVGILGATRHVLFESRRLAEGIGYIHFTNFIAPVNKRLVAAFEEMRDARGVLIDLRGNTGGDTEVGLALASLIVDKETQLAITRFRKGDDDYYKAKPHKRSFRGPVVILLDEESRSESEQVAAGLQAAGRVVIVGTKTKGVAMDATFQQLPMDSFALLYPAGQPRLPSGAAIEGRGVLPDVDVSLTRRDLLNGRDAQLDAAVQRLQK